MNTTDYSISFPAKPQPLTLEQAARKTPPMQITDTEGMVDIPRMRRYRLDRVREQIAAMDCGAIVLLDPLSIRYTTGVRNCALFQSHILAGYLFVPAEGPVTYFDTEPGFLTGGQLETIDEICDEVIPLSYMFGADRSDEWAAKWAARMADLVDQHCHGNRRLGIERVGTRVTQAFANLNIELFDAADIMAMARKIKCPEEILCMNQSIAVAENGMARMRENLRPGTTEIALWSQLWQACIEGGGEWIEYRLLSSGDRTNPWQQEASSRIIRAGDLVVFDCGMIGPFGYGADISRSFFCGPGHPGAEQKKLYTQAYREVVHNTSILEVGKTFSQLQSERFVQPDGLGDQPYPVIFHGLGQGDEWPVVLYPRDDEYSYPGGLEAGMVICVESYVGEVGGHEGVKLENMVLITDSGPITLSTFPFESDLLDLCQ